jgi:hypothetical protein
VAEKIFIKSEDKFEKITLETFSEEKPLKKIIIDHPELLPFSEIRKDLEFFPISSEMKTNHGPLDILGIDQYGGIYIVETKLYKNRDVRKIMAQAFDYSGGLSTFREDFELFKYRIQMANQGEANRNTILENKSLEDLLENIPTDNDIIKNIEENFKKCNFSYILVLDNVEEQLKDDIKLFNEKDDNPMFAVKISKFIPKGTEKEIVISTIFGTESRDLTTSSSNYSKWITDGESVFFKNLDSNTNILDAEKNTVTEFISEVKKLLGDKPNDSENYIGYYNWGSGSTPRFSAKFYQIGHSKNWSTNGTFTIQDDGSLVFLYPNRNKESAQKFAVKFNEELRKIPEAKKILELIDDGTRRPRWEVHDWVSCKDELVKIIRKVCQPVKDD